MQAAQYGVSDCQQDWRVASVSHNLHGVLFTVDFRLHAAQAVMSKWQHDW
jgi:hypothetical protein